MTELVVRLPELQVFRKAKEAWTRQKDQLREKRAWKHQVTYIRGEAAYAAVLGRGKEKVSSVDIDLVSDNKDTIIKQKRVSSVESAEHIFVKKEFKKIKEWLEREKYRDRKVNLTLVDKRLLRGRGFFENEPKMLIWNEEYEKSFFSDIKVLWDVKLRKYKRGGYEGEMSKKLIPVRDLVSMFRVMDIGKTFDLEYEDEVLNEAEKRAKNATLSLRTEKFVDAMAVSPKLMDVYTKDRRVRKLLLKNSPRLGQVLEEVNGNGGIEKYISRKFGDVYLDYDKDVTLRSISLSGSTVPLDKQADFIDKWNDGEVETRKITLKGVKKLSDGVALARPKNFQKLISGSLLSKAIKERREKKTFLDKAQGRYELKLDSPAQSKELKDKIKAYLKIMNLDWPSNVDMDTGKVTKTLIKLGVHPKDPVLTQFTKGLSGDAFELVVSSNPIDILHASTDKPWTSCLDLSDKTNKEFSDSLYSDIGAGAAIAYLLKDGKYLGRKLIRAGYTIRGYAEAAGLEEIFGEIGYGRVMTKALKTIFKRNGIDVESPMKTYPYYRYASIPYTEMAEEEAAGGEALVFIYNRGSGYGAVGSDTG